MANTSSQTIPAALLLFIWASMIVSNPATTFACEQILTSAASCATFVQGLGIVPPIECCIGIGKLNIENHLMHDRQEACKCFQRIFKGLIGYNPLRAAMLPPKCGVNLGYTVGLLFDCSKLDGKSPGLPLGLPATP